ncbi:hypothetical protein [Microbacterium luticocti]|uniref:hypothetical protein n=1 Tax=Microbacterium luticocti TaxID=451764 RepID=UPI0004219592|nr:hypothetical protein [Microbacterium luticocti]
MGRGNRKEAAKELYLELFRELKVPAFENERAHLWRTTLHSLCGSNVPTAVLGSQFGNSEKI